MRFKVPQNVQREDRILGPITLKQLIVLLLTGGVSYLLFTQLNKIYYMNQLQQILIWTPLAIGAAFCFIKIKGLTLFQFILLKIEQTVFLPGTRFWQNTGDDFVSMTQSDGKKKEKEPEDEVAKDFSADKVKNLAALLDGESPEANRLQ